MFNQPTSAFNERALASCCSLSANAAGRTVGAIARERPTVSAILLSRGGKIISSGVTGLDGNPRMHAEAIAIAKAGEQARAAHLYCTLEPCAHDRPEGNCTDKIISSGITKVVIAMADPDPRTHGRGITRLRRAGIDVTLAPLRTSLLAASGLVGHIVSKREARAAVVLKMACSSNGFIGQTGERVQISSPVATNWMHGQRAASDAVAVGYNTFSADQPRLDCRLEKPTDYHQPARIFFLSRRNDQVVNLNWQLLVPKIGQLKTEQQTIVIIAQNHVSQVPESLTAIAYRPELGLRGVLSELHEMGITRIMLEGGATLAQSFIEQRLVDMIDTLTAQEINLSGHNLISLPFAQPLSVTAKALDMQKYDSRTFASSQGTDLLERYAKVDLVEIQKNLTI